MLIAQAPVGTCEHEPEQLRTGIVRIMINNGIEARRAIRNGEWTRSTAGLAPAYTQANLVVLPREHAYDFLLFCQHNPKPCPVLEVTDTGSYGHR